MNANLQTYQRRFLLPLTGACALAMSAALPTIAQDQAGGGDEPVVNVTDYDVVDIAVKDAELAQVLQMLSLQSRKNIISSKNVSATVTANLYDVTFKEALDAILKVNGYTWVEEGNFIYVYTQEEYNQIQDANRQTVGQIFDLNHLSAASALELITPFLSDRGRAAAQGDVEAGFVPDTSNGGADGYAYNVRIVINDYPENIERIAELLRELDTKPDQVLVEATIIQTLMDEANAFGIDFSVVGSLDFANIVSPLNPVGALITGGAAGGFQPADNSAQAGQVNVGNTAGPGGLKLGLISNDVSVFLRVLDEVTDNTILARPKIMALNRQRAEVLVGARVGYLSTTATETTTTQTVQFLDTGVQLVFRPFISKDGTIRMELKPSVSEASLRTVTDSVGANVTIPDELTNEVTTNVRIRDGQTLVLGGLFREATQVSRRQVPVLGDIPIVGAAFRGQDDSVERSEIIFLITPTITHDDTLWENGEEMMAMSELVRIGAREGLLPFSRDKLTASHNQSAIEARNAGDTDLAMYHINNSLRMNANQPSLIEMRQQLSGETEMQYERSLLERALSEHVKERESQAMAPGTVNAGNQRSQSQNFASDPLLTLQPTGPAVEANDNRKAPTVAQDQSTQPWWSNGDDMYEIESAEVPLEATDFDFMRSVFENDLNNGVAGASEYQGSMKSGLNRDDASTGHGTSVLDQRDFVQFSWWFTPFAWSYSPHSTDNLVEVKPENEWTE